MDADSQPYRVELEGDPDRFRVVNDEDRTVCVCRGRPNAEHYATLMNEAYARGYRRGRRDSRQKES